MFPEIRILALGGEIGWILEKFLELGFSPLVDSVNLKIDCTGEHRYYQGKRILISWNVGDEVGEEMWGKIDDWVERHFGKGEGDVSEADAFLKRPDVAELKTQKILDGVPEVPLGKDYELRFKSLEGGVMIYEVTKPNTDRPYTVVNRQFRDHVDFFSSLFVCQSWGVSRKDIAFLAECWKHLEMEGKLDLEHCVAERIRRCREEDAPEPEVYRRSLEFVERLVSSGERCVHFAE